MSALELFFAVVLTVLPALGLLLASRILEGPSRRRKQMFVFYTNLSNAAVMITHALMLFGGPLGSFFRSAAVRYMTTLCILVTFVIYFFVLTRLGRPQGTQTLRSLGLLPSANFILHYAVPLLTLAEWIAVAEKRTLGWRDAFLWLLIPLAYLGFAVLRAARGDVISLSSSRWPYGFMDKDALGTRRWLGNLFLTLCAFFILGVLLLAFGRLLTGF